MIITSFGRFTVGNAVADIYGWSGFKMSKDKVILQSIYLCIIAIMVVSISMLIYTEVHSSGWTYEVIAGLFLGTIGVGCLVLIMVLTAKT